MAIISRFRAVAMVGKLRLTGVIAWLMWLAVHLIYITGFKSRVTALLHWAVSFLGRGRSERTTTEQQVYARAALGRLKGGAADLVSEPGAYDAAHELLEVSRRQELEAKAREEARLTDDERGCEAGAALPADPSGRGSEVGTVVAQHPHEGLRLDHRASDHERLVLALLDDDLPARQPGRPFTVTGVYLLARSKWRMPLTCCTVRCPLLIFRCAGRCWPGWPRSPAPG